MAREESLFSLWQGMTSGFLSPPCHRRGNQRRRTMVEVQDSRPWGAWVLESHLDKIRAGKAPKKKSSFLTQRWLIPCSSVSNKPPDREAGASNWSVTHILCHGAGMLIESLLCPFPLMQDGAVGRVSCVLFKMPELCIKLYILLDGNLRWANTLGEPRGCYLLDDLKW